MPTSKPFHDSSRRVLDVQELAVRIAQGAGERGRNAGQRLIERLADHITVSPLHSF